MGLARQTGELSSDTDRDCDHPAPHDDNAVAIVSHPNEIGAHGLALCPYHLALWDDIHPGIAEKAGVEHLIPDNTLLHLDDLPETHTIGDTEYARVGIDHTGTGHYILEDDADDDRQNGHLVLEVDADLSFQVSRRLFRHITTSDYVDHIDSERGWMLIDEQYAHHTGGDT